MLLVVVDYYSGFYEVLIMRLTTAAEKVMDILMQMFSRYGHPFTIKSDNGPTFRCQKFTTFLSSHGIEHRTSPPLWPQAQWASRKAEPDPSQVSEGFPF